MNKLQELINDVKTCQKKKREFEYELEIVKGELDALLFKRIPDYMASVGLEKVTTSDNDHVQIKSSIKVSLTQRDATKRASQINWLIDNDLGNIIKDQITMTFNPGDNAEREEFIQVLEKAGYMDYLSKRSVHNATLTASLNELLEQGINVPLDEFGFEYKIAKIN